jgi:AcrR family transcriptional regulator
MSGAEDRPPVTTDADAAPGPHQPRARTRGAGRSGRRPGEGGTRGVILEAARLEFAELGYDRATIRGIAARAAVDPALVLHYFAAKEKLFAAALTARAEPGEVVRRVMRERPGDMGATVVRTFLDTWEPEETRAPLVAMVRSAMTNEVALRLVREYLGERVFGPITEALGAPDARLRATLVGTQLIGLAMARYIAGIEPLASAPREVLVTALGPTIQRYLTGDLSGAGT